MELMELIRTRKSVRTFDGNAVSEEDRKKLSEYIRTIDNPYGIPVKFVMLGAKKHGLSSPVIQGEHIYIMGKVPKVEHCAEAFGYSFEKMVLYAWSLGIGTTWIGGTMKRELFEQEAGVSEGEIMPCVTPIGYPAKKRSIKEIGMRTAIKADKRIKSEELFYENDFSKQLHTDNVTIQNAIEAVRLAPSAVNKQPWRIVKCGNDYHFYEKKTLVGSDTAWDVQKVDLGIAICHFMSIAGGDLSLAKPDILTDKDTEYIATAQYEQEDAMAKKELKLHAVVAPTQTVIVSAYDKDGKADACTLAFYMVSSHKPPCVTIAINATAKRKTLQSILESKAFVLGFPNTDQITEADYLGVESGYNSDKLKNCGFTTSDARTVHAPVINEILLSLECELVHSVTVGSHTQLTGEVKNILADERILNENGRIVLERLKPIIYNEEEVFYMSVGEKLADAFKTGMQFKKQLDGGNDYE